MSVRVRFAPSPTGHLHIGGARTALYCYLFARANKGSYIVRIEDTDKDRSTTEFEHAVLENLNWLKLVHDEGPDVGGEYGPYRQSDRLDIYKKYADILVEKNLAYYAFDTEEELQAMRDKSEAEGTDPHYEGKYKNMPIAEAKKLLEQGLPAVIRFRVPRKSYKFKDHVRGEVTFPKDMVGDFVIMRSNGLPVYNFCCVVDDALMKISHVIRAEDHLPNTLRQLMVYEALEFDLPEFVHLSLLVGKDRQKLSKRHGATSVGQYKDLGYQADALLNYLALLGWSHPQEIDTFTLDEIIPLFDLQRFSKSAATYDMDKLNFINGQHLKKLSNAELSEIVEKNIGKDNLFFTQDEQWKLRCVDFLKNYLQLPSDIEEKLKLIFGSEHSSSEEYLEVMEWESSTIIKNYLICEIEALEKSGSAFITEEIFSNWLNHIKKELKIKGKPLFKGVRAVLTGFTEGPDLKQLIPLTPIDILKKRL